MGEGDRPAIMGRPEVAGEDALTTEQAFQAMRLFLQDYRSRVQSEDLDRLLSDIGQAPFADGGPADPAAWDDWLKSVRAAIQRP